jgi:hypothetical protein
LPLLVHKLLSVYLSFPSCGELPHSICLKKNEPEVLLGSAKGLENFETLKKATKACMYEGCGKEWTVLRFMLHLLIVNAKFG